MIGGRRTLQSSRHLAILGQEKRQGTRPLEDGAQMSDLQAGVRACLRRQSSQRIAARHDSGGKPGGTRQRQRRNEKGDPDRRDRPAGSFSPNSVSLRV